MFDATRLIQFLLAPDVFADSMNDVVDAGGMFVADAVDLLHDRVDPGIVILHSIIPP
jgi:hypothetical protein